MFHESLLTISLVLMGMKAAIHPTDIHLSLYSSGSACLGQDKARTADSCDCVGHLEAVLVSRHSPLTEKCASLGKAMLPRP